MMDFLKLLKLDQLSKTQKFILAAIFIVIFLLTPFIPKFMGKPTAPTINSSNTGIEKNSGISNKGIDSRSTTTNVVGDGNTVINNSNITK